MSSPIVVSASTLSVLPAANRCAVPLCAGNGNCPCFIGWQNLPPNCPSLISWCLPEPHCHLTVYAMSELRSCVVALALSGLRLPPTTILAGCLGRQSCIIRNVDIADSGSLKSILFTFRTDTLHTIAGCRINQVELASMPNVPIRVYTFCWPSLSTK